MTDQTTTVPPAVPTAKNVAPVRRSARFQVTQRPGSPGRRFVPCHHSAVPGPSSLKDKKTSMNDANKTVLGFYSKASLELYIKKKQRTTPRTRKRKTTRKKVTWSRVLEW